MGSTIVPRDKKHQYYLNLKEKKKNNPESIQKFRKHNPPIHNTSEWSRANADLVRNNNLKSHYGITLSDYNNMFDEQNGCCAICGKHQSVLKRALHVDHNHNTGNVRGLLCPNCNSTIGQAFEKIEVLEKCIKYLERHNG